MSAPGEPLSAAAARLATTVQHSVLGQHAAVETMVAAYAAGGHVLLEGVPGIGKTLLARCFAASLDLSFARVQFTPDLTPADVIGTNVFDPESRTFRLVAGPIFTQILMADEINRTPPKTQSALLEAMQERQVTIDGVAHALSAEFFVVATQNPIEFEGTYTLPEAQLDRFLARIEMKAPDRAAQLEIYRQAAAGELAGWNSTAPLPTAVMNGQEARALRGASTHVHVAPELLEYLARLSDAVAASPHVELPPSPRGALALMEMARGGALVSGRDFITPEDLKRFLVSCWGHRILLTAEAELEGFSPRRILEDAASSVEVPR